MENIATDGLSRRPMLMTTSRITSELWEKISRSWQEDSELSKIIEQVQQDPSHITLGYMISSKGKGEL